ncbi:hypothetical protein CBR_g54305 [Chara braunii]|uniref:Uncharacterized protein n=1 Tax=Chara braunii TaxID=69332 RepID=A0A388MBV8_CHABU|nr:hypothetical protein CBR_g54305 [Chara braunii]|eukprot:GBG92051.1 hypothetical protein CBR_g54305 [Chara braunii]
MTKEKEYCTLREVEELKKKRTNVEVEKVLAEARKLEAEAEITRLRERMERLSVEAAVVPSGGTNLKGRLEEAAASGMKTVKRGRPRITPTKTSRKEGEMEKVNDRFVFIREESKKLRALKKSGLEAICRQEGITYKTVETTTEELTEIRVDACFGRIGNGVDDRADVEKRKEASSSQGGDEVAPEVEDVPSDSA